MVSHLGVGAPGARKCGQAADRPRAESPGPLHGRPSRLSRMRRQPGSVDVVLPAAPVSNGLETREANVRVIGLDCP